MFKPWPWVALLILVAALTGGHVYLKNVAVKEAIIATTAKLNKEYQTKLDASVVAAAAVSNKLQLDLNKDNANKDVKIKNLTASLNSAVNSLSKRPKRQPPSVTPNPTSPSSSCTGANLYAEDGGFLAGEAARADKALIDRDFYYNQYEKARSELESLKSK